MTFVTYSQLLKRLSPTVVIFSLVCWRNKADVIRLPICLAVYWSHLSLLPEPCEPAGLFQSSLMAGWRSKDELSYMCHENWLLFREGLTQLLVEGRAGWIQLSVPCPWQQLGGWWTCMSSLENWDTGHLKSETICSVSCLLGDVLKEMG